jgi:hypothetical protein
MELWPGDERRPYMPFGVGLRDLWGGGQLHESG